MRRNPLGTGLHFPPFGYPSRAARIGATVEGKKIPGLGDENSRRRQLSLDLRRNRSAPIRSSPRACASACPFPNAREARSEAAAPTGVAADADAVYVTLAHDDALVKVNAAGDKVIAQAAAFALLRPRAFRTHRAAHCAGLCPAESPSATAASTSPNPASMRSPCSMPPRCVSSSTFPSDGIPQRSRSRRMAPRSTSSTPRAKARVRTPAAITSPASRPMSDPSSSAASAPSALPICRPAGQLTQTVVAGNMADIARRPPLPHLRTAFWSSAKTAPSMKFSATCPA